MIAMGHTGGVWVARPVVVGVRARVVLVGVLALVAVACAVPGGAAAAGGVKKCRQFTLVRIKHGRRVHVRVTKCVVVRSKACTVTWSKEKRHGKVVIRQGNPVWVAKVTCPTTGPSPAAQSEAVKVLALPPRQPADIKLFPSKFIDEFNNEDKLQTEGEYPQGSAMNPATGPALTSAQIRSQLQQFLAEQLGTNKTKLNEALSLYDSANVQTLIPDPKLRAAFAGLTGATLEPAINYFLKNGAYFSPAPAITYGDVLVPTPPSQTRFPSSTTAHIDVSSRYEKEPWQLFVALIGHELQHTQFLVNQADEVITNFELAIEYAELLAKHPQLAYLNTELARRLNGFAQLFLDARHAGSAQNVIIAADGLGLAPGSTNSSVDWWGDYGVLSGETTPAPPVDGLAVLTGLLPGVTLPNPLNYDQTTAGLFEHMADPNLTPVVRLRISVLLQLVSVSQIATKLGITSAQAIATFGLQPILNIIAAGQHAPA